MKKIEVIRYLGFKRTTVATYTFSDDTEKWWLKRMMNHICDSYISSDQTPHVGYEVTLKE